MSGLAYTNEGPFTLTSGEALVADRLVLLSTTTAMYADAGQEPVGLSQDNVASGAAVAVQPLDGRPRKVTGSKAISAGAAIYAANDGKVSDAAVGKQLGIMLSAITGDGGKGTAIIWGPRGGNDLLSARNPIIEYFDDFFEYDATATVGNWAVVEDAGAGTGDVLVDAAGGVLNVGPDGDDNDEVYVSSIAEIFQFQATKRLYFEARVKLTEANTDDANVIIGLSDTVAADSLLDDGGGPMASYDGAVFFKVDGGTKWQFEASNAGTQDTNTDVGTRASGTWVVLGFTYDYNDGTTAIITPYVNGVADTAVGATIAGMAEMHILLGCKAGGTGTEEIFQVDYVHVVAER